VKKVAAAVIISLIYITSASALSLELASGLEAFFPSNPDLYGKTLINNNWPDYVRSDFNWKSGDDRVQLYTPNSYDRLLSFYIAQRANFNVSESFLWGIELSERFRMLIFAPAKDVDILFRRQLIPISLAPFAKFMFGKFDAVVGAGGSTIYHTTEIFGKDFYRQEANPFYDPADEESDEPRANYTSQRFGRSGWAFGYMAKIGFGYKVSKPLRLGIDAEYSGFSMESLGAKIVNDGYNKDSDLTEFHWKEKTISGDAGGFSVILGISYQPTGGE